MTVKDLIELNAMITDLEITVRKNGDLLWDQLNIGCSEGVKPPYPTRVPKDPKYAGKKWFKDDRTERLKSYIDESLSDVKEELYALIANDSEKSD